MTREQWQRIADQLRQGKVASWEDNGDYFASANAILQSGEKVAIELFTSFPHSAHFTTYILSTWVIGSNRTLQQNWAETIERPCYPPRMIEVVGHIRDDVQNGMSWKLLELPPTYRARVWSWLQFPDAIIEPGF